MTPGWNQVCYKPTVLVNEPNSGLIAFDMDSVYKTEYTTEMFAFISLHSCFYMLLLLSKPFNCLGIEPQR